MLAWSLQVEMHFGRQRCSFEKEESKGLGDEYDLGYAVAF